MIETCDIVTCMFFSRLSQFSCRFEGSTIKNMHDTQHTTQLRIMTRDTLKNHHWLIWVHHDRTKRSVVTTVQLILFCTKWLTNYSPSRVRCLFLLASQSESFITLHYTTLNHILHAISVDIFFFRYKLIGWILVRKYWTV